MLLELATAEAAALRSYQEVSLMTSLAELLETKLMLATVIVFSRSSGLFLAVVHLHTLHS